MMDIAVWQVLAIAVICCTMTLVAVWLGAKLVWTAMGHEDEPLLFKDKAEDIEQDRMG